MINFRKLFCDLSEKGGRKVEGFSGLSGEVSFVMERLAGRGFKAYAVGGCVRDILRGETPHDYDVNTDALPSEIKEVFSDFDTIDIGIAHGTVAVKMKSGELIEVTTFRTDGEYKDSRHPESVSFTKDINGDLSRRDFTVNSIAMDISGEIIDPFDGKGDIQRKVIRCTGDPERRFTEDALRIMRALRFSSVFDFEIEDETARAIHEKKELLLKISPERIFSELKKLLCGKAVFRILTSFSDVICTIIPELQASVGFEHKSKYHMYDVYTHTARTVESVPPDPVLRLTMLFHDSGKPFSYTEDGDIRHFLGHPEVSADIARTALRRLRGDGATISKVCLLCELHDRPIIPEEKYVRRLFSKLSIEDIRLLCAVRMADSAAHAPDFRERGKEAETILSLAEKINDERQCVTLKDLAVNGHDIAALGFSGPDVGRILSDLLELVITEEVPNEKEALLKRAEKLNM